MRLTPIAAAIYAAGYGGSFAAGAMPIIKYPKPVVYDPERNAEACRLQMQRDNAMATAIKRHNHAVAYRNRKFRAAQQAAVQDAMVMDDVTAAEVRELEEQDKVMGG